MALLMTPFMAMPSESYWFVVAVLLVSSLMIGSFLNVVIYRLPIMLKRQWQEEAHWVLQEEGVETAEPADTEKPAVFNLAVPASTCPSCHKKIRFWQNIPVISFLLLRGRCGHCKTAISWRYPLVELTTLLVAGAVILQSDSLLQALPLLLLSFVLIALIMIDYDHQLLPDNLTFPLLWLGLLLNTQGLFVSLSDAVWGAALGFMALWSVFWLFKLVTGKEGMGYGDFKLLAVFGAWFGWQSLTNTILLSSLTGAVWGILLIVLFKRDSQKPMPFGPFIAVAGWLGFMFPEVFDLTRYLAG